MNTVFKLVLLSLLWLGPNLKVLLLQSMGWKHHGIKGPWSIKEEHIEITFSENVLKLPKTENMFFFDYLANNPVILCCITLGSLCFCVIDVKTQLIHLIFDLSPIHDVLVWIVHSPDWSEKIIIEWCQKKLEENTLYQNLPPTIENALHNIIGKIINKISRQE